MKNTIFTTSVMVLLDEIALKNGWINKFNIQDRIKFYKKSNLADYLNIYFKMKGSYKQS